MPHNITVTKTSATLSNNFKNGDILYTGCPRRKGPNFGRVFLRSNYTDITQSTYIQSSMVTEILAREKCGLLWCLRTVTSYSAYLRDEPGLLQLHSYVIARCSRVTLATEQCIVVGSQWTNMTRVRVFFVVLFNGFKSLTSYFDEKYRY